MGTSLTDDFAIYLHEMGLSEYEASAYLCVLQIGVATAKEVAEGADIPQSRVYDVLSTLDSKGFVTIQPGRPKKFGPVEPEIAVNQFIQYKRADLEEKIAQDQKIGSQFLEELDNNRFQYRQNGEMDIFWSYKGKNYILKQFGEYCASSSSRIRMITRDESFNRIVTSHKELLSEKKEKGVNIQIISSGNKNNEPVVDEALEWAEVREYDGVQARVYVFDSQRVLVSWNDTDEDQFVAIATQSPQLQQTFDIMFELVWQNSDQLE